MSRKIVDSPGGWRRALPGHVVQYENSFAQPFAYSTTMNLAGRASQTYTVPIIDTQHIFFVDSVMVANPGVGRVLAIVNINDVSYVCSASGSAVNIPLRANPSVQLIAGDHLDLLVTNAHADAGVFNVVISGTKIKRPANFGHSPAAYWTVDSHAIVHGGHVHFTEDSEFNPTSWDWDFRDGSPHSTEQHPTHTYLVAGSYYPMLKATNAYGYDNYAQTVPIVVS
jgi:hypothetical protein